MITKLQQVLHFIYQFLFIAQQTKQISHTKFWSQIGYALSSYVFVLAFISGSGTTELFVAYATIVLGNKTLIQLLKKKEPPVT